MPLATCRTAASKTGLVGACARCRAVPRCAPGPPPTGGTGFGSGIAGKCKCVCVCNNGDKSQAAGWEGAGGAGREAHQQEPRWTFSTCPRKASNARPRDRPPARRAGTARLEPCDFWRAFAFEGFQGHRDTMPTVEGGICAAVLLVRLAHPNLGGFTAVSGWAITRPHGLPGGRGGY